jgi:hypothetical protein
MTEYPYGTTPDPAAMQPPAGSLPPELAPRDGVSIAALVTGILGLVPIALGLGIAGVVRTAHGKRRGNRMARIAVLLAALWIAGFALLIGLSTTAHRDDGQITKSGHLDAGICGRVTA